MVIIKCDRCGHETKVDNPMNVFSVGQDKHFQRYTITTFRDGEMKLISLCGQCEKEFDLFLKRLEIVRGDTDAID